MHRDRTIALNDQPAAVRAYLVKIGAKGVKHSSGAATMRRRHHPRGSSVVAEARRNRVITDRSAKIGRTLTAVVLSDARGNRMG